MFAEDLELALRMAGQVLVTETQQETRLAVASGSGTERVAFSAVGDTCPLCLALDGKVFRADSDDARRFTPPLHINCDCIWTGVGDDEVGAVDWFTPADAQSEEMRDLIESHGHFVTNPDKYTALKVPSGPTGRDFTFRRGKAGEPGTVEWRRPRYELDGLDSSVKQSGVTTTGPKFETLKLKTLKKAETISEMEAWAVQRFPHMTFDLAKGELESVRAGLAKLDELGRLYRDVEASIPRLQVLSYEEFGATRNPLGFGALNEQTRVMSLNGGWWKDPDWLRQAWARDVTAGRYPADPHEAVIAHEFGEAYRLWLQQKRPNLWADVSQHITEQHPAQGIGGYAATSPTEGFAEGFTVMHTMPRDTWAPYVNGLREKLRYEVRKPF